MGGKFPNIKVLREATEDAKKREVVGSDYIVIREVELFDHEFKKFCIDFLNEQPWIEKTDGGSNAARELRCIRVKNVETGERVLAKTEGYDYPRYTAIEE
ncbi:hypothetical protein EV207_1636 [Scopulibacillus darangshiensis]|uniref:Uncharacterized protein n=1 Tax=Scopulibacillus darangshiensis TaxID=442528 RepID=A0A4R2NE01_9BACL|nr:hypothetical protein [Scopulibacillus darangshiensis]TCP19481.1 hypothetical protein EV207_1636 [Scopulibacillus darangshiensis]